MEDYGGLVYTHGLWEMIVNGLTELIRPKVCPNMIESYL